MPRTTPIETLRGRIDRIDDRLLALLNARARLVQQVGNEKAHRAALVYDPAREKQIVELMMHATDGPLEADSIQAIYSEIISAIRALDHLLRVSFFGPSATFTH